MNVSLKILLGTVATALALTGCSGSSPQVLSDLAPMAHGQNGRAGASGPSHGSGAITYHNRASRHRLRSAPRSLHHGRDTSRPQGSLRRFAAMPRHKPHAPHVRQHETSCIRSGIVQPTSFIRPRNAIGGGQCYIARPFRMSAAARGAVRLQPAATLRCQMVPSVETWVKNILRPAARRYLGSDVVRLRIAASYACRSRNSKAGARLSEHGRANAIDISAFTLADGRVITVKRGWRGKESERRFLRYVHRGACEHFSTVLGPNADRYHHDHLHFDLARHGRLGTYRVCK